MGIAVFTVVFILYSLFSGGSKSKTVSFRDIDKLSFTYEDMTKVNEVRNKTQRGGSGYKFSSANDLIDEESPTEPALQEYPILRDAPDESLPESVPAEHTASIVTGNELADTSETKKLVNVPDGDKSTRTSPPVETGETPGGTTPNVEPSKEVHAKAKEEKAQKRKRNGNAFMTVNEKDANPGNVIKAAIHDDQSITSTGTVKIRTLEVFTFDGVTVPANTFIYGSASIQENRVNISITSIRLGNNIYQVSKTVFDTDGLPGIFISDNLSAEGASEAKGSAIDEIPTATGTGLVGQTVNAAVQSTKSVMRSATRQNRITLKANYKIYLK